MPAARRITVALSFGLFTALLGAQLAVAAGRASAAPLAPPEAGRRSAQLCVATLPKPPSCGPAQVELRADGAMRLRVDDIVYSLRLHSSQVEVVVMHNVVQIGEFIVPYEWVGNTLQFVDADRNARYEVRFAQGQAPKR